jgi:hypothetical protein
MDQRHSGANAAQPAARTPEGEVQRRDAARVDHAEEAVDDGHAGGHRNVLENDQRADEVEAAIRQFGGERRARNRLAGEAQHAFRGIASHDLGHTLRERTRQAADAAAEVERASRMERRADVGEEPRDVRLAGGVELVEVDAVAQESLVGDDGEVRLALSELVPLSR